MVKNKIINIIMFCIFVIAGTGAGSYIYYINQPVNVYERALKKTISENRTSIKNTVNTTGEIDGLTSQTILCSTDKEQKILEVSKADSDTQAQLLIVNNTLYLKDKEKYVNIADNNYIKTFTNNIKMAGNTDYDNFQEKIQESISKENLQLTKVTKKIGNIDVDLRMVDLVVPQKKAEKLISEYVKKDYEENAKKLVEETVAAQEKISNIKYTEEETNKLKAKLNKKIEDNLKEKLDNMSYSDIKIKVGIDNKGYIRYKEEKYSITLEGKSSNIQNITEYIAFGKNVEITNPNTIEKESLEEYLNNQKEKQKTSVKDSALNDPDGNLDLSISTKTEEKTQQKKD